MSGKRQGNTKFYLKICEKSGNSIFGYPPGLGKGKVMLFEKTFTKEFISVASLLALLTKNLSFIVFENCLWSVKSQVLFINLIRGKPWISRAQLREMRQHRSGYNSGTFSCCFV